jgi:hypothetical protein
MAKIIINENQYNKLKFIMFESFEKNKKNLLTEGDGSWGNPYTDDDMYEDVEDVVNDVDGWTTETNIESIYKIFKKYYGVDGKNKWAIDDTNLNREVKKNACRRFIELYEIDEDETFLQDIQSEKEWTATIDLKYVKMLNQIIQMINNCPKGDVATNEDNWWGGTTNDANRYWNVLYSVIKRAGFPIQKDEESLYLQLPNATVVRPELIIWKDNLKNDGYPIDIVLEDGDTYHLRWKEYNNRYAGQNNVDSVKLQQQLHPQIDVTLGSLLRQVTRIHTSSSKPATPSPTKQATSSASKPTPKPASKPTPKPQVRSGSSAPDVSGF